MITSKFAPAFIAALTASFLSQPVAMAFPMDLDGSPTGSIYMETDGSLEWSDVIFGEVRDVNGKPVVRASVVYQGKEIKTDANGAFTIRAKSSGESIVVKKPGHRKVVIAPRQGLVSVTLEAVEINSLYMQTGHMKRKSAIFKNAMELLETTELNALTIDVKDDEGRISVGLKPYIDEIHAKGFYAIARIVTFKDNIAPRNNPAISLMGTNGKPWQDRNNVTYLNPFNEAAWDYVLHVAKQAVEAGFDEIQFDYVRFPTDGNRSLIKWPTDREINSTTRTDAIAGFLAKARKELGAMGAYIAADVFGITAFDNNDSGIGQRLEGVVPYLDYVCPMVYPSGYAKNTDGIKNPVDQPGAIVETSIRRYRVRAEKVNQDVVIRPWLQAFRDYAYSRRDYTGDDIRAQINGSNKAGGSGYLLWNAASKYSAAGLKKKSTQSKPTQRPIP